MKIVTQTGLKFPRQESDSLFVPLRWIDRALIIGISYAFLLFIAIKQLIYGTTPALFWLFLALSVNLTLKLVPIIFYRSSFGWLHPLVFGTVNFLFTIFLRQISLYLNGLSEHVALPGWSHENLTMLVTYSVALDAIGTAAYYFGFFFGPKFVIPRLTFSKPKWVGLKALLVVAFSVIVFAYYTSTYEGINALFILLAKGRTLAVAEGRLLEHWVVFVNFGVYACLLWFALDREAHRQILFWVATALSLTLSFLSSASRSSIIVFFIYMLLIWMLREQKFPRLRTLILPVLGLLIIGILGDLRMSAWKGEVNWMRITESSSVEMLQNAIEELRSRSEEESAEFAILALVPDQVGFLYGRSYLSLLATPIPRALWSSKPQGIDALIGETFFSTYAGKPAGAIGEAYWNFHIPGVIVVFFLFGSFHKWLVAVFRKYAGEPVVIVFYATTLFLFSPAGTAITSWVQMTATLFILAIMFGTISIKRLWNF